MSYPSGTAGIKEELLKETKGMAKAKKIFRKERIANTVHYCSGQEDENHKE